MSDGGRESGRSNESSSRKIRVLGGDEFGRAISKMSVAQICESSGFQSFQGSALDSLSDLLIRYICDLGKTAHFYANISGRTGCNVFDIIQGLEDMGSLQGFPGASEFDSCLVSSSVVSEITRYVNTTEEVPFTCPVPHFPIARQHKSTPSFAQTGETPSGKHIPNWLPVFPDPHTYIHTPVWNERATDPRADKIEQARQRRKAERSLVSLQQRLARNGMVEPVSVDDGDIGKGKRLADSNPFLAPPLPFEEKDVSEVAIANEAHRAKKVSVLETFGPVIEAMKSGVLDSGVNERKFLPDNRPTVHFKVGIDKKSIAASFLSNSPSAGKSASFFLRDDEIDDKKRRAEMILKEAMENPHELTQL